MFLTHQGGDLTEMATLAVVILAAGQGTRMQSKKQKILHEVGGRPMVGHIFEAAVIIADRMPVIVVGPGEDGVPSLFGDRAVYVVQKEQLGTGHATRMAEPILRDRSDQVVVVYGDMPLLRSDSIAQLAQKQADTKAAVALLTVMGEQTSTFGRVVRNETGRVVEIVEVSEARRRPNTNTLLAIREQNAGVYCFAADWLWDHLPEIPVRQARIGQEYYLTDMIELAVNQERLVTTISIEDSDECLGAGTRGELVEVEKALRRRANRRWLAAGVTLVDPDNTYIDQTVMIGRDTTIWPNTFLQGDTIIGEDCHLGPNSIVRNSSIGNGCRIEQAVVEDSVLQDGEIIYPFHHIQGRLELRDQINDGE